MASLVYTAIVSGAIGLLAGVMTADSDTIEKIRESLPEDEASLLDDCEQCVLSMEGNLGSPDYNPQIEACERIQKLDQTKLEALIRKFLSSGRIDREKIRSLAEKCKESQDNSTVCSVVVSENEGEQNDEAEEEWFTDNSFDWSDDVSVQSNVSAYNF